MSQRLATEKATSTRRDFIKTSGALAGGAVLGSLALERSAHAAGDGRLKVGLVGCGGRGTGAAANALSADANAVLTAVADPFAERINGCLSALRSSGCRSGQGRCGSPVHGF